MILALTIVSLLLLLSVPHVPSLRRKLLAQYMSQQAAAIQQAPPPPEDPEHEYNQLMNAPALYVNHVIEYHVKHIEEHIHLNDDEFRQKHPIYHVYKPMKMYGTNIDVTTEWLIMASAYKNYRDAVIELHKASQKKEA